MRVHADRSTTEMEVALSSVAAIAGVYCNRVFQIIANLELFNITVADRDGNIVRACREIGRDPMKMHRTGFARRHGRKRKILARRVRAENVLSFPVSDQKTGDRRGDFGRSLEADPQHDWLRCRPHLMNHLSA